MNLIELLKTLETMQKKIGNNCFISFSTSFFGTLKIETEWFTNHNVYRFRRIYTLTELAIVQDVNVLLDRYCTEAENEFDRKTNEEKNIRPV